MAQLPPVLERLTNEDLFGAQCRESLKEFAHVSRWQPSDVVEGGPGSPANGHLVVDHGLDQTAMISFLRRGSLYGSLDTNARDRFLSMSYNNLVEWHLFYDRNGVTFVFNLQDPPKPIRKSVEEISDYWHALAFDRIVGRRPSPNLKRLDDALIETLSMWRRTLAGELAEGITDGSMSALFNAIILVRGLEDYKRSNEREVTNSRLLIEEVQKVTPRTIGSCVEQALKDLGHDDGWHDLIEFQKLTTFDRLHPDTVRAFFTDFYQNRFALPYTYDFSIISKHALSRVYERYVTRLEPNVSAQTEFLPPIHDEVQTRQMGSVYTPQFIARYFARFLRENHTPPVFRRMRVLDPSCGSGIFLRTILELQCDPLFIDNVQETASSAFLQTYGIDSSIDACNATRLSLALLHLVLTGTFPESLQVEAADALRAYIEDEAGFAEPFDAIVVNPPFVAWNSIPIDMQENVQRILGPKAGGKTDLALAFLKIGMSAVKDGGYLLYVLPHSFLAVTSAAELRREIGEKFWVRHLVDLSGIRVFENVNAYVVLLVLQKIPEYITGGESTDAPQAIVVKCRDFAGQALQDALDCKTVENVYYEVFEVPQRMFRGDDWTIAMNPKAESLLSRVELVELNELFEIRQGFVTGADDIFIVPRGSIPKGEEKIFVPYLPDREMLPYAVPSKVDSYVFFPQIGSNRLSQAELEQGFPKTWQYLLSHRDALESRRSVVNSANPWWRPVRMRTPSTMLRPKIVSPHLVISPRFSLDEKGRYGVSHSPMIFPREGGEEVFLLRYVLAVLNSSVVHWQLMQRAHKYSRGYLMLEVKTLKKIRIPSPALVQLTQMAQLQEYVDTLLRTPSNTAAMRALDELIVGLYGLDPDAQQALGIDLCIA